MDQLPYEAGEREDTWPFQTEEDFLNQPLSREVTDWTSEYEFCQIY